MSPNGASNAPHGLLPRTQNARTASRPSALPTNFLPIEIGRLPASRTASAGGSAPNAPAASPAPKAPASSDWLTVDALPEPASSDPGGISSPWHPVARAGGGAAMAPRGGSGNGALPVTLALVRGQVAPVRLPAPPSSSPAGGGGASSGALLAAVASSMNGGGGNPGGNPGGGNPGGAMPPRLQRESSEQHPNSALGASTNPAAHPAPTKPSGPGASPDTGSGGSSFGSTPAPPPAAQLR